MRYIIELYARNIINVDEVDSYISSINFRDEKILKWLKKKARKYIIEEVEAKQITYNESMPDWAKNGDIFEVVLTDDLTRQINNIVDYLSNVLIETPDFDIQLIRWEEAVDNSEEFHNELVKISKDNVNKSHSSKGKVYHKFENGFFWTELLSEDAAEETELMGNCMRSYAGAINDGDVRIFSLRDPKNRPHVDIECNPKITVINQIEGKSAAPIATRYIEYIKWFVYHKEFTYIHFDDAKVLKPEYEEIQKEKLKKLIEKTRKELLENINKIDKDNSDIVISNEFGIIIERDIAEVSYLKTLGFIPSWSEISGKLYLVLSNDIVYIHYNRSSYHIIPFKKEINVKDSSLIISFFNKMDIRSNDVIGLRHLNVEQHEREVLAFISKISKDDPFAVISNEFGTIISRDKSEMLYLIAGNLIPERLDTPDNLYLLLSDTLIYILQYKTKYMICTKEKKINEKDSLLITSFFKEKKVNRIIGIEKLSIKEDLFQIKEQKVNDPFKNFAIDKKSMVEAKRIFESKLEVNYDLIEEINSLNGIEDIVKIKKLLKGKFPSPHYTYSGTSFLYFLTFLNDKEVICELLSTNNLYVKGLVNIFCDALSNPEPKDYGPVRYRLSKETILVATHKRLIIRNRFISLNLTSDDFSLKSKNTMGANRNKFFTLLTKAKQVKH